MSSGSFVATLQLFENTSGIKSLTAREVTREVELEATEDSMGMEVYCAISLMASTMLLNDYGHQ